MNFKCIAVLFATLFVLSQGHRARADSADITIADFEGTTWGDWKTTGDALGSGPTNAELATKLDLENFTGHGVCTTKANGDGPTGTLTSPPFTNSLHYISFLISGGR